VPPDRRFRHWQEALAQPWLADAVIIALPDAQHTAPCLRALRSGYHVLLEKPIAPTEAECRQILQAAREAQADGPRVVGVCHVLRYTPYFRELKALIDSGSIGQVISVQHLEPIEHTHMSHSYVRGAWRNSREATPIILAKSCHDTDIIRWLVGSHAENVHCFGNLKWFTQANAPAGSTERCTDGCAVEGECAYSALKIYWRERKRLYVFDLPENDKGRWGDLILQGLKTTDYGRCVYRMDNDQPDHLTVNILFADGVTAGFSMEAHVSYEGRRTRIMGSQGDIVGNMESFTLTSFASGQRKRWSLKTDAHGGGDHRMLKDFLQAVGQRDPALLSSSIEDSVESHLMAFAAEKSRVTKTIEDVRL
jgi:predicted dehydrogenase